MSRQTASPGPGRPRRNCAYASRPNTKSSRREPEAQRRNARPPCARQPSSNLRAARFTPSSCACATNSTPSSWCNASTTSSRKRAAGLEARLGPLLNALVVAIPKRWPKQLAGRPRELESIWLVAADAQFLEQATDPGAHDVVVVHGLGSRITRVPAKPMLGRRARLARAHEPAPGSRADRDSTGQRRAPLPKAGSHAARAAPDRPGPDADRR